MKNTKKEIYGHGFVIELPECAYSTPENAKMILANRLPQAFQDHIKTLSIPSSLSYTKSTISTSKKEICLPSDLSAYLDYEITSDIDDLVIHEGQIQSCNTHFINLVIPDNKHVVYIARRQDSASVLRNIIVGKQASCIVYAQDNINNARSYTSIHLTKKGAQGMIYHGFNQKSETQADIKHQIYHTAPQTSSKILSSGIVEREAVIHYRPKITMSAKAIGSKARQSADILKSSTGRMHICTLPELDIATNEVRCSHGVNIAPFDTKQLHYLQSRGISQKNAKQVLKQKQISRYIPNLSRYE